MAEKVVIGNAELWHGDCMEILPTLGKVDAVITDPPYGMKLNADFSSMASKFKGSNGGNKYENIIGDDQDFDPSPFLAMSKNVVLFGADYFCKRLPESGTWLVWDKRLDNSADKMFGSCFEIVWTSTTRKKEVLRHKWAGIFGMEREDNQTRVHPTQKPIELMGRCINFYPKAQTILDPFMGSGTTGVACAQLGKAFTGIERERKYFDIACERIARAQAQGTLLPPEKPPEPVQEGLL